LKLRGIRLCSRGSLYSGRCTRLGGSGPFLSLDSTLRGAGGCLYRFSRSHRPLLGGRGLRLGGQHAFLSACGGLRCCRCAILQSRGPILCLDGRLRCALSRGYRLSGGSRPFLRRRSLLLSLSSSVLCARCQLRCGGGTRLNSGGFLLSFKGILRSALGGLQRFTGCSRTLCGSCCRDLGTGNAFLRSRRGFGGGRRPFLRRYGVFLSLDRALRCSFGGLQRFGRCSRTLLSGGGSFLSRNGTLLRVRGRGCDRGSALLD
jgi:hypothetical protein